MPKTALRDTQDFYFASPKDVATLDVYRAKLTARYNHQEATLIMRDAVAASIASKGVATGKQMIAWLERNYHHVVNESDLDIHFLDRLMADPEPTPQEKAAHAERDEQRRLASLAAIEAELQDMVNGIFGPDITTKDDIIRRFNILTEYRATLAA